MTQPWQPYREPLWVTLRRTVIIAIVVGALVAWTTHEFARWPMWTLLMLWPSFGGHWVEIFFLNWLRPRIADSRAVQMTARVAVWFVGGCFLAYGMRLTAMLLVQGPRLVRWPAWWVGGVAFVGIELVAQLALRLRGNPAPATDVVRAPPV